MGPSAWRVLRLRQQTCYYLKKRSPTRGYASDTGVVGDHHLRDPTPTDLLRATLNAHPKSLVANSSSTSPGTQIEKLLDEEWKLGSPPAALWSALKHVHPMNQTDNERLDSVADLSALRRTAEKLLVDKAGAEAFQINNCESLREVLRRCERHSTNAEILSTLNDIIARFHRLGLPLQQRIYSLAMYYAAEDLLPSALRLLIQEYSKLAPSKRSYRTGSAVLHALYQAIDSVLLEDPHYDMRPLLVELFGEEEAISRHQSTFRDGALWQPDPRRENWTIYLCILARIGSKQRLEAGWKDYLGWFNGEDIEACHSAYDVIVSLIQARRPDTAARFLEDISQKEGDNLPFIATFANVQLLVNDAVVGEALSDLVQGKEYIRLLESRFEDIERRLAIQWTASNGKGKEHFHSTLTQDSSWDIFEDQPLLTIDGDSAGYDHPVRLYYEVRANGCSRSVDAIGKLVNLLNEQDGNTLEIFASAEDQSARPPTDVDLRWCPEHSPIEFSGSLLPALYEHSPTWTPATLGLIRARSMIKGIPQGGTRCLHLMQLGSVEMRLGLDKPWQPSGYIMTWDRQHGELIALWVGKNYGVVDPGPTPPDAPFGTIMHVRTKQEPDDLPLTTNRVPWDTTGAYYLDVDPGADLDFQ